MSENEMNLVVIEIPINWKTCVTILLNLRKIIGI